MRAIVIIIFFGLLGCTNDNKDINMEMKDYRYQKTVGVQDRITVEKIGEFYDKIAYGGTRGVYLITDTKNNKECIGISGVGISITGSHHAGKSVQEDDRQ